MADCCAKKVLASKAKAGAAADVAMVKATRAAKKCFILITWCLGWFEVFGWFRSSFSDHNVHQSVSFYKSRCVTKL